MDSFEKRLETFLLKYKNADFVEVAPSGDETFVNTLKMFFRENGDEFFPIIKKFIWDLDFESPMVGVLLTNVIHDEDYESDAHTKMLLDIIDNHIDKDKRLVILEDIKYYTGNILQALEDRYEGEKNMKIRNRMGYIILQKLLHQRGWDLLELDQHIYDGNMYILKKYLPSTIQKNPAEYLNYMKFLRDSKYIPNNSRAYLEELVEKLEK